MKSFIITQEGNVSLTKGMQGIEFNLQSDVGQSVLDTVQDVVDRMVSEGIQVYTCSQEVSYEDLNIVGVDQQLLDFFDDNFDSIKDSLYQIDPPDSEKVNTERDVRLKESVGFNVSGYSETIYISGADEQNLIGLIPLALIQTGNGNGASTLTWRDNNNFEHIITYDQLIELYLSAASYKSSVYESSWVLKGMNELPENYTNDLYWP